MTIKEIWKKPFGLALMSVVAIGLITGCRHLEEDTEMDSNTIKTELVEEILRLDASQSEEDLKEEDTKALKEKLIQLKVKQKRDLTDDKLELDKKQPDDDPTPPNPPIYEKPEPVPNPPIEEQ